MKGRRTGELHVKEWESICKFGMQYCIAINSSANADQYDATIMAH